MQTMKCEKIQSLIARYLRDELSGKQRATVTNHLNECVDCRQALAFHRYLDSNLNSDMEAPGELRDRLENRLRSTGGRLHPLARFFGDPTMKRILISSTALTAIVAAALVLTPGSANASTPAGALKLMRSALAAAARSGELTFSASIDGNGAVTVTGTLDGQPLPKDVPLNVSVVHSADSYEITTTADLSPAGFSSIRFGKDHSTLELVPKKAKDHRIEIGLDPSCMKPVSWTSYTKSNGEWKADAHFDYKPKETGKPAADAPDVVTAHMTIKMSPGQSGSISIQKNP